MNMRDYVPKCMSTQHPDNVHPPFFSTSFEMSSEDEVQEAYYVFSHLKADEQMWDSEGKEVDNYVVRKLLSKYGDFFQEHVLGEEVFITYRVPNPTVEKAEAKILLETLESIPRAFDSSKLFYQREIVPVFEVILPMTSSHYEIDRVYSYYKDVVVGKGKWKIGVEKIMVSDWIGEFKPEDINVIPLFEEKEKILNADEIIRNYLKDKDFDYMRVFLARSDPALNYGNLSAVLMNKVALYRLHKCSKEIGVKMFPIIGVGSPPFRGNMRPDTVDQLIEGYPSVHTFTIQSSFKYDNNVSDVQRAIAKLKEKKFASPIVADDPVYIEIIEKYSNEYANQIRRLARVINNIAKFVPKRRKRKLHVGLFGYSRESKDIKLPRAISFTASMYSLGVPPELLGINALDESDIHEIKKVYKNFDYDLRCALRYFNPHSPFVPESVKKRIDDMVVDYDFDKAHFSVTNEIIKAVKKGIYDNLHEHILRAASIRKFLG